MKSILTVLKLVLKYAAYVTIIIEIVSFAINKVEGLKISEDEKKLDGQNVA